MSTIIEAKGLTKVFPGGITAVDDISFSVKEGEIFGFLGPNGAGKSTTIAMLTTLINPTKGGAIVDGMDIIKNPYKVRLSIGYVSQDLAVDDSLTGNDNLRLQAGFYHIPRNEVIFKKKAAITCRFLIEDYSQYYGIGKYKVPGVPFTL